MATIVAMAVILVFMMIIPAFVSTIIAAITMTILVTRNVFAVVPVVPHKVDPLAAGVVLTAVFTPVFRVAWRHVQVDRWARNGYPLDDHRSPVDHLRLRVVTDVDTAIEAGLADADRDADVGADCRRGDSGQCRRK